MYKMVGLDIRNTFDSTDINALRKGMWDRFLDSEDKINRTESVSSSSLDLDIRRNTVIFSKTSGFDFRLGLDQKQDFFVWLGNESEVDGRAKFSQINGSHSQEMLSFFMNFILLTVQMGSNFALNCAAKKRQDVSVSDAIQIGLEIDKNEAGLLVYRPYCELSLISETSGGQRINTDIPGRVTAEFIEVLGGEDGRHAVQFQKVESTNFLLSAWIIGQFLEPTQENIARAKGETLFSGVRAVAGNVNHDLDVASSASYDSQTQLLSNGAAGGAGADSAIDSGAVESINDERLVRQPLHAPLSASAPVGSVDFGWVATGAEAASGSGSGTGSDASSVSFVQSATDSPATSLPTEAAEFTATPFRPGLGTGLAAGVTAGLCVLALVGLSVATLGIAAACVAGCALVGLAARWAFGKWTKPKEVQTVSASTDKGFSGAGTGAGNFSSEGSSGSEVRVTIPATSALTFGVQQPSSPAAQSDLDRRVRVDSDASDDEAAP